MTKCRKCGEELTDFNWYSSLQKRNIRICIECYRKKNKEDYQKTKKYLESFNDGKPSNSLNFEVR
jgi:hypothetical protein